MSESFKQPKGEIVISDARGMVLKRATLIRRGIETLNDLENQQIAVHEKTTRRILFVDPDELTVSTFSMVFKCDLGYDCCGICWSYDWEDEVLKQVYSNCYDFLIIAHVMPRTNGPELIKRIRNEGLSIPIILTTGWTEVPIALEAMKSGADDLFIKPMSQDMFTSSFDSVLKQKNLQIKNRSSSPQVYTGLKVEDMADAQIPNLHGLIRDHYETGEFMAESTYNEGKLHGVSKVYRKYGPLLFEGSFKNGIADGRSKWFTAKGQVYLELDHRNGDCLQRKNYDSTGKTRQVLQYRT